MSYQPRLKERYRSEIVPVLQERFGYTSIMQVPKLTKISINQGVGAATQDKKLVDAAVNEMTMTFIPKMLAVAIALLIFFPWMLQVMIDFMQNLLNNIPTYVR